MVAAGSQSTPSLPDDSLPDALAEPFAPQRDDTRDWLTGLTHLVRPGGLGDFRVLVQARGLPADRAASAISWLDSSEAGDAYTPAELAAMIPAEALALDRERLRLAGPALL